MNWEAWIPLVESVYSHPGNEKVKKLWNKDIFSPVTEMVKTDFLSMRGTLRKCRRILLRIQQLFTGSSVSN